MDARLAVAVLILAVAPTLLAQSTASRDAVRQLVSGGQIRVATLDGYKVQGGRQSATEDLVVLATSNIPSQSAGRLSRRFPPSARGTAAGMR